MSSQRYIIHAVPGMGDPDRRAVVAIDEDPAPQRPVPPRAVCGCGTTVRLVIHHARGQIAVDEDPVPGGLFLINGDTVVGRQGNRSEAAGFPWHRGFRWHPRCRQSPSAPDPAPTVTGHYGAAHVTPRS